MPKFIIGAEDLGGTKSLRGLFEWDGCLLTLLSQVELLVSPSTNYTHLSARADRELQRPFSEADVLSHAVAGLIAGRGRGLHVKLTAFPRGKMELGEALHSSELGWKAKSQGAVNDFVAQAWAMNLPEVRRNREVIIPGRSNTAHDCLIFGPGTGCGVAKLIRDDTDGNHFTPSDSEGGNLPFPLILLVGKTKQVSCPGSKESLHVVRVSVANPVISCRFESST